MALNEADRNWLKDTNKWRKYRGAPEVPATIAEIRTLRLAVIPVVPQVVNPALPPAVVFTPYNVRRKGKDPGQVYAPTPGSEHFAQDTAFLAQTFLTLPNAGVGWDAMGMIARGGQAGIGLWEWVRPPGFVGADPRIKKVAVKEMQLGSLDFNLLREEEFLTALRATNTTHVSRLVFPGDPIFGPANVGNQIPKQRIYLEYYQLGDLENLLANRIETQFPFSEATLWTIFNCFVDGMSAMHYGSELLYDEVTDTSTPIFPTPPGAPPWVPIVHFDIKPANIFLGDRDMAHTAIPVFKYGDFGLASRWPPPGRTQAQIDDLANRNRWTGTEGYYPPEQYTKEWEYANPLANSTIAGQYSTQMNIWQTGVLMFHLVTLRQETVDEIGMANKKPFKYNVRPFFPAYNLNGAAPVDFTFAPKLRAYSDNNQYSVALIDLIYECLYQNPASRPDLTQLKSRVALGLKTAFEDPNVSIDPWQEFLNPLPKAKTPAAAARRPRNRRLLAADFFKRGERHMRCQAILPTTGLQCRVQFKGRPTQNPKCKDCKRKGY